jgi:hypothetical protein
MWNDERERRGERQRKRESAVITGMGQSNGILWQKNMHIKPNIKSIIDVYGMVGVGWIAERYSRFYCNPNMHRPHSSIDGTHTTTHTTICVLTIYH